MCLTTFIDAAASADAGQRIINMNDAIDDEFGLEELNAAQERFEANHDQIAINRAQVSDACG